jgi:dihydroorotate dehydrogenase (NAD+) catalytic subunit
MMKETGVHAIEANFSCPNEGDHVKKLLCYDAEMGTKDCSAIKKEIGELPLVIKISYFESEDELRDVVQKVGPHVQGIAAINTIPAAVYKQNSEQALPAGPWRLKSGICGYPIKWAGVEMVKRLKKLTRRIRLGL